MPPFDVLVDTVVPDDSKDTIHGGKLSAASFPWVHDEPLTVKGKLRVVRIEDVIARNGPRSPPYGQAQKEWTPGIALMVGKDDPPEKVAAAKAVLDSFASTLAPTFNEATGGRGKLRVVTSEDDDAARAPTGPVAAVAPPGARGCACELGGGERGSSWGAALAGVAIAALARWRRRALTG